MLICPLPFFTSGSFCRVVIRGFLYCWTILGLYICKWVVGSNFFIKRGRRMGFGVFPANVPSGCRGLFFTTVFRTSAASCIYFFLPVPSRSACHSGLVFPTLSSVGLILIKAVRPVATGQFRFWSLVLEESLVGVHDVDDWLCLQSLLETFILQQFRRK